MATTDLVSGVLTGSVTVDPQALSTDFTVAIRDDSQPEDDEDLIATLVAGQGYTLQNPFAAQVTIPSNADLPVLAIEPASSTIMEGGAQETLTISSTPPTGNLTVRFMVAPYPCPSGAVGSDYRLTDMNNRELTTGRTDRKCHDLFHNPVRGRYGYHSGECSDGCPP